MSNIECKHCVNLRCPAGQLRGIPCEPKDQTESKMNQTITKQTNSLGQTSIKFKGPAKHPKSGPRSMAKGDNLKYDTGYDRIWADKEPICDLCKGQAEIGTCPTCC